MAYNTDTTGNAGTADKLKTARTVQTNLASTSTASFDGTANITPGVTGTLPVANGGTGVTTLPEAVGSFFTSSHTYKTTNYYYCNSSGAVLTSAIQGNGTVRLTPWVVVKSLSISALFCEFTAAGEANSVYRIGIWNDDGTYQPGTLLLDAGTISTGTGNAGTVTTGGTPGVYAITGLSTSLSPGIYWVGGAVQGASSTQPTMRVVSSIQWAASLIPSGTSLPSGGGQVVGISGGTMSGAFTNVSTATSSGIGPVRIGFRVT